MAQGAGPGKGTQPAQPKPKGGPAQQQDQQNWWEGRRDNRGYNRHSDLKSVVKVLGKLGLRQEDSLSVIQLDCQFVIFMKITGRQQQQPPTISQTGR